MRLLILLSTLILVSVVPPTGAVAQVGAQAGENYDALVKSALASYDIGRFVEARTQFRRAHALSPSARTLRGIGMCSFNLGDYLDATLHLEAAQDDATRPLSPEQRTMADELLDRAARKIGRFRLSIVPDTAAVTVDGQVAIRSVRGDILVEPGRHELAISAAGYRTAQRVLSVDPGDRAALEVRLEAQGPELVSSAPSPLATTPEAPGARTPLAPLSAQRLAARRFGIAAVSLGAAGLGLFAVGGSLALETKHDLDKECTGRACPPVKHDDVDTYERQKVLAAVGLYGGLALVAAGVGTLWWRARANAADNAHVAPVVGLGYVGLRGAL